MTDLTILPKISAEFMQALGVNARASAKALALSSDATRQAAVLACANAIDAAQAAILTANERDMAAATDLTEAQRDRLYVDAARLTGLTRDLRRVAELPDPLDRVLAEWERPNGMVIQRVSVPLGVIAVIYESRPNVTADAAVLCLKAGNAAILRAGSECLHTALAMVSAMRAALVTVGLPADCVQLVPSTDREAVRCLLSEMRAHIDVLIPRGGKSLVERVQREARVPVMGHLDGNCHIYIDASADPAMALAVVLNAKLRRTGVCGALESLLIHAALADSLAPKLVAALLAQDCEIRGDAAIQALDPRVRAATETDWSTEYLAKIISIKLVNDTQAAIDHINHYGSHHTDAIISEHHGSVQLFLRRVDSAIVIHNASTQFADGGEFGFGAEIGIATDRLHARGPVGIEQLTSYQYRIHGHGQIRPI